MAALTLAPDLPQTARLRAELIIEKNDHEEYEDNKSDSNGDLCPRYFL